MGNQFRYMNTEPTMPNEMDNILNQQLDETLNDIHNINYQDDDY